MVGAEEEDEGHGLLGVGVEDGGEDPVGDSVAEPDDQAKHEAVAGGLDVQSSSEGGGAEAYAVEHNRYYASPRRLTDWMVELNYTIGCWSMRGGGG